MKPTDDVKQRKQNILNKNVQRNHSKQTNKNLSGSYTKVNSKLLIDSVVGVKCFSYDNFMHGMRFYTCEFNHNNWKDDCLFFVQALKGEQGPQGNKGRVVSINSVILKY